MTGLSALCQDVRAEVAALRCLVERPGIDADALTPFHQWRVRDSIQQLVMVDRLAFLAFTDPERGAVERQAFADGTYAHDGDRTAEATFARMAAYESSLFGALPWPDLVRIWLEGSEALLDAAADADADAKLFWFGPPIRAGSLLSARQMEVWAYGQDIFDLYGARRNEGDRLRNIVDFAVRTFGFSFAIRGEKVPDDRPELRLTAPSGASWVWNEGGAGGSVEGSAVDLCLVATQRRHVKDTGLAVEGPVAERWMLIAQCISGPPLDGPAPGERARASAS